MGTRKTLTMEVESERKEGENRKRREEELENGMEAAEVVSCTFLHRNYSQDIGGCGRAG